MTSPRKAGIISQPGIASRISVFLARANDFPMRIRMMRWVEFIGRSSKVIAPISGGLTMALDQHDLVQRELLFQGVYERDVTELLASTLCERDVFLDIGANCGYYSLLAAARGAKVVAFEPDPDILAVLQLNIGLNIQLGSLIKTRGEALSNEDGSRRFFRADGANSGMSGFSDRRTVASFDVVTRKLDSLLDSGAVPSPTVMKVDVEGHEESVLRGAIRALESADLRYVIFEAAPAQDGLPASQALRDLFQRFGFGVRQIGISGYVETENFLASRGR